MCEGREMYGTDAMFKLTLYILPVTVKDLICNKDINILGTRFFVFLNATLGTQ